jgi:hypothetical protein
MAAAAAEEEAAAAVRRQTLCAYSCVQRGDANIRAMNDDSRSELIQK